MQIVKLPGSGTFLYSRGSGLILRFIFWDMGSLTCLDLFSKKYLY